MESLLVDEKAKKFLIVLLSLLFLGIMVTQSIVYITANHFKMEIMAHDYELAGYLSLKYPQLASEIQGAFTAEKLPGHLKAGKALLEQAGYKTGVQLYLIPRVRTFHKIYSLLNFIYTLLFSLIILFIVGVFLKSHYQRIDQYNNDINEIMNGKVLTRLDDYGEGSLAKLASSINTLTASLYTHIEKEKQSRIFLKDILTNVSHQLKTPLAALMMYTEIMKDECTDNKVIANFLAKSENELERMEILIRNLLKLARLDAGIIKLNKSSHSLKEIIGQVVEGFEVRLHREQKTYEVKASNDITYLCDREWMFEALSNLFKNAVEHTIKGNHLEISLEETPVIIKVIIEDNGEGIHPDDINHIFKRFYRSKCSQSKQGTGIGLSLARTIIEMHGGFIAVESKLNKGTKFTVNLPSLQNCKL